MPRDLTWIDRTGLQNVSLVQTLGAPRGRATRAALLEQEREPGRPAPGRRGDRRVRRHPDHRHGRRAHGRRPRADHRPDPVRVVRGAGGAHRRALRRPRREPRALQARRTPRLSLLVAGLYTDGWLAHGGRLTVWPDASGRTRRDADPPALAPEGHAAHPDDLHRAGAQADGARPVGRRTHRRLPPERQAPVGAPLPHHGAPLSRRRPRDQRQARRAPTASFVGTWPSRRSP